MASGPGIEEPRPHWWEASALTTASTLLPCLVCSTCRAVVLGNMYCFVLLALPALLHKLPFRVLGAFEGSSADARRIQEPFSQTMQCNVSACWKTRRNPLRKHTRVYFGHLHHQHRACGKENKVKSLLRA